MSIDSISQLCRIIRDSVVLDDEAVPGRVATIEIAGVPVDLSISQQGTVWRIEVLSPAFVTTDSLAVGTTLARLLALPDLRGAEGEGVLYVQTEQHCGLSFRMAYWPGDEEHRSSWDGIALRQLPGDTKVDRILVLGCR